MQKSLYKHFLREGHNSLIHDVEIIFINKTDPSVPTRREKFQRTKLKTLETYGFEFYCAVSLVALAFDILIILAGIMYQNFSFKVIKVLKNM